MSHQASGPGPLPTFCSADTARSRTCFYASCAGLPDQSGGSGLCTRIPRRHLPAGASLWSSWACEPSTT